METYLSADGLARALAGVAEHAKKRGRAEWYSTRRPYCDAPRSVTLGARAKTGEGMALERGSPCWLDIWVPCRKCQKCLVVRKLLWKGRIMSEVMHAQRTWFVTLTFRPSARESLFAEAPTVLERSKIALKEISDYLKRLRAACVGTPTEIRFFAVTEPHKDDFPHVHLLLHSDEMLSAKRIRAGNWKHGFISMKLCDDEMAGYLVKYITKEVSCVRASLRYGKAAKNADKKSGPATKALEAKSEEKQNDPHQTVRIKMLNKAVGLDDGVELLSTILSLTDGETTNGSNVQTASAEPRNPPDDHKDGRDDGESQVQLGAVRNRKNTRTAAAPRKRS